MFEQYPTEVAMQRFSGFPTPPSANEDSLSSQLSPIYDYEVLQPATLQNTQFTENENLPPFLTIMEQPVDMFRFRYKSEMTGTHGNLNGETSDKTRKMTYPTVELNNFSGSATIRCSIWQIDQGPHELTPHAHRLVRKKQQEEEDDPHDMIIDKNTNYLATFYAMGIIHTAKRNIFDELSNKITKLKLESIKREGRTELNQKEKLEIKEMALDQSKSINLNVVCLRFDAFTVDSKGCYWPLCPPVFSHPINNKKSALTGDLKIVRMDHCTSPASGGREIFLLVERITKKNIQVRFYEVDEHDTTTWEAYGKFNDLDVHHQYAIVLKTPPYRRTDIKDPVTVFMELVRPSNNARSDSKKFTYVPLINNYQVGAKRTRPNDFDINDYDSFETVGEMIPTTIQRMSRELDSMDVNSEELVRAMADIDSDEFKRLFEKSEGEYTSVLSGEYSADCPFIKTQPTSSRSPPLLIKRLPSTSKQEKEVDRVYGELSEYLRTKPAPDDIKKVLKMYLLNPKPNAFQLSVMIDNKRVTNFFVKLIRLTRLFHLVNEPGGPFGTVLHLAVLCNNLTLVKTLVSYCRADITKTDSKRNTPLHLATEDSSGILLEELLKTDKVKECINMTNDDNETAFYLAVSKGNRKAVQLLHRKGANVNHRDNRNGYTPLRLAVQNSDLEMIKLLLNECKVDAKLDDYKDYNPLQVALHNNTSSEIVSFIQEYMLNHNMNFEKIFIKEELEDEVSSDEDALVIDKEIKEEPTEMDCDPSPRDNNTFTEDCLEFISSELDRSGKFRDLAMLLDVQHLFRMQMFNEKKSPTKQLLDYVMASSEGNVKEIRDFLESLDETASVQAIDKMIGN